MQDLKGLLSILENQESISFLGDTILSVVESYFNILCTIKEIITLLAIY